MDPFSEVVDCLSLFIVNILKQLNRKDIDINTLKEYLNLKLSSEQPLTADYVGVSLGSLISQLQKIKEKLSKKDDDDIAYQPDNGHNDISIDVDVPLEDSKNKMSPIAPSSPTPTVAATPTREQSDGSSTGSKDLKDKELSCAKTSSSASTEGGTGVNPNIVQIKASRNEIERRISAFIEQKQREVNQQNNREFCSVLTPDVDAEFSCARTEAVFVPRAGCKSHIKVSRVVNAYGPQTRLTSEGSGSRLEPRQSSRHGNPVGLEERMQNIESHLQLMSAGASKADVYCRLKVMEERILYLEGLSPEYFQDMPVPKRQKKRAAFTTQRDELQDMSVHELDERITSLQASLKRKLPTGAWQS